MAKPFLSVLLLLVLLFSYVAPDSAAQDMTSTGPQSLRPSSIMFVENVGQWDARARFQVRGGNNTLWLAEDALWLTVCEPLQIAGSQGDRLERPGPDPSNLGHNANLHLKSANVKLSFVVANPHPAIQPFDPLDTVVSYFIGDDPEKWRPDVPVWGGVRYVDLYPGVDLELTSEGGRMAQRLVAQPGADLTAIRLRVEGAAAVAAEGDALHLSTAAGDAVLPLLQAGKEQVVGLNVQPRGSQAFDVMVPFVATASTPHSQQAVPHAPADNPANLLYGTFLGANSADSGSSIAVDRAGSVYVTGDTYSIGFPTTPGAFDTSFNGGLTDAFVVKLNPTGSGLAYAAFLGGGGDDDLYDVGNGIAVDGAGSAYVTGVTGSSDFPTTPGAFDTSYNGGRGDAFVVKLNPTGSGLDYATFLGGSGFDSSYGIVADGVGSTFVAGETRSSDFPTTPGAFDSSFNEGSGDVFAAKLDPTGSGLTYATFLGGSGAERGREVAVDGAGSAYVTGYTASTDFPTTPGAFHTSFNGGSRDAFVVKLNQAGTVLAYATFLGGGNYDLGSGIAVDAAGSAYVTGRTYSSDFPITAGAFDTSYDGNEDFYDAFVAELNPAGSGLAYATFLGGSDYDDGISIAVDGTGSACVTGQTWSADFPTTPGAFDTTFNGGITDAFVVKMNPAGAALVYATFLGASRSDDSSYGDGGDGIAVDAAGSVYVAGDATFSDFPTTPGAFDTSFNAGLTDAFVVKLAPGSSPPNFLHIFLPIIVRSTS